ncbi:polyphosphate kinase 2 [Rhodococcoides yunnanense]|uniref:polyphosphate kinase 2 n=1 Tax=Rhodococcoides yunnanense TaxID=278209 RepID=UPI00093408FA|nr:polyphosphate kinase 2 [Rhodococcus yunnanensis]
MAKKDKHHRSTFELPRSDGDGPAESARYKPMKNKEYRRLLRPLHGELVALQEWVKSSGAKICIVFEGRDTAGKGGVIKAITERVSPRVFRVVALPAPTDRERSQMYIQRYLPHLPAGGEVVIFDRSWYNRVGVERVMGFCSEEESEQFLQLVPEVERAIVDSGVILLKYWLEVSEEQQTLRLQSRIDDPRKLWKLSDLDIASYTRWYDYSRARDDMFHFTDTGWAPWYVAVNDDKKSGRLNIITHILDQVPYTPLERTEITLPKRRGPHGYTAPRQPLHWIPTPYRGSKEKG